MFRPLLMDKPLHGMTLIAQSPMLYRTAAKNTKSTPCTFLVSVACCVKNTPCPIGTEGDERGTTSGSPLSRENDLSKSKTSTLYRAHPSSPIRHNLFRGLLQGVFGAGSCLPSTKRELSIQDGNTYSSLSTHCMDDNTGKIQCQFFFIIRIQRTEVPRSKYFSPPSGKTPQLSKKPMAFL